MPKHLIALGIAATLLVGAASVQGVSANDGSVAPSTHCPPDEPPDGSVFKLKTGFSCPVGGPYQNPQDPLAEFGCQGDADTNAIALDSTGPFVPARTGTHLGRVNHVNDDEYPDVDEGYGEDPEIYKCIERKHMGIIDVEDLPGADGFIGVAHYVTQATLTRLAESEEPYIELLQMSPTNGSNQGKPVTLRLYTNPQGTGKLRLGIAGQDSTHSASSDFTVVADTWFYTVMFIARGTSAALRLDIYDANDARADRINWSANTTGGTDPARQKVGGETPLDVCEPENGCPEYYTYHDDWYIAETDQGPLEVSE